ncbi:ptzN [Candidatus Endolissoclinum faulkneri L2]|uniref:PtzN n=2 Tax=Candidatus Endolissoclinum faulkneri TaxID=1263979 RepID=K7YII5_9PROT|nr:ptzN [Candidatus Endolissoclinum faulkneri L2]
MMKFAADPVGAHRAFAARYGDPFTLRLPGMRMMVIGDANSIIQVLALPIDAFSVLDVGIEVMGVYSLVRLNGAAHSAARKQVAPLVMNPLRQNNGVIIQDIARRVYAKSSGRRVLMIEVAKQLTLHVILRSAIGFLPEQEEARFAVAYAALQSKASFMLHFLPILQVDLGPWSPWGRLKRARATVDHIISKSIDNATFRTEDDTHPFVDIARAAKESTDAALGVDGLRDQLFTLLSAGHASTAQALTWAVWHVYADSEILARLRDELASVRSDPDRIVRLDYLDAVCREVLRLRPIGPVIGRKLAKPLHLAGRMLPEGTVIGLSVPLAHSNLTTFPEPDIFRPERYLGDNKAAKSRSIPFGGGVRHCLGANLGLTEMKLALAILVEGYDVLLSEGTRPPKHKLIDAVAGPASGVPLVMTAR